MQGALQNLEDEEDEDIELDFMARRNPIRPLRADIEEDLTDDDDDDEDHDEAEEDVEDGMGSDGEEGKDSADSDDDVDDDDDDSDDDQAVDKMKMEASSSGGKGDFPFPSFVDLFLVTSLSNLELQRGAKRGA